MGSNPIRLDMSRIPFLVFVYFSIPCVFLVNEFKRSRHVYYYYR